MVVFIAARFGGMCYPFVTCSSRVCPEDMPPYTCPEPAGGILNIETDFPARCPMHRRRRLLKLGCCREAVPSLSREMLNRNGFVFSRGRMAGPRGAIAGPCERIARPRTRITGPREEIADPRGKIADSRGTITDVR